MNSDQTPLAPRAGPKWHPRRFGQPQRAGPGRDTKWSSPEVDPRPSEKPMERSLLPSFSSRAQLPRCLLPTRSPLARPGCARPRPEGRGERCNATLLHFRVSHLTPVNIGSSAGCYRVPTPSPSALILEPFLQPPPKVEVASPKPELPSPKPELSAPNLGIPAPIPAAWCHL